MVRWHKSDLLNRMYINVGDGKKAAMPRYYKDKIYTNRVVVSSCDEDGVVKIHSIVLGERDMLSLHHQRLSVEREEARERELVDRFGIDDYKRVQVELHKQLFSKMYSDAEKDRFKV